MKKTLSVTLALVMFLSSLFCLSSCNSKATKKYAGKEIEYIEHVYKQDFSGTKEYNKYNFKTGEASYKRVKISDPEVDWDILYTVDATKRNDVINALYSSGLLDMKEYYAPNPNIHDDGEWEFTVMYSDGTQRITKSGGSYPKNVFGDAAVSFYDITGESLFDINIADYIYEKFPHIHVKFDKIHPSGGSSGTSGFAYPQAYTWKHQKRGTLGEVTSEIEESAFYLDGVPYTVKIRASKMSEKFHRYRYNTVSVVSYDENLNDKQNVDFSEFLWQIKFTAEPYRIYVITMEFNDGTIQYHFNNRPRDGYLKS